MSTPTATPIPRIIHQTWKDDNIPPRFQPYVQSWKHHHPGWEYMLWTDEDNRALIEQYYPQHLRMYDSFRSKIQRVDAARYFILHRFGGVYADLDFECLRPLDAALECGGCVLGQEPTVHARDVYRAPSVVSNALMASSPEHPVWPVVWDTMARRVRKNRGRGANDVLRTTGPAMLDYAVRKDYPRSGRGEPVHVYAPDAFFPKVADKYKQHTTFTIQPFAVHHWANTWIKKT